MSEPTRVRKVRTETSKAGYRKTDEETWRNANRRGILRLDGVDSRPNAITYYYTKRTA